MLAAAHDQLLHQRRANMLFVDEIHRFNKAQQDVLLPGVEEGEVILVGRATDREPVLHGQHALVSRSRIFQFQPLTARRSSASAPPRRRVPPRPGPVRGPIARPGVPRRDQRRRRPPRHWPRWESACSPAANGRSKAHGPLAEESVQRKAIQYDRDGDAHYDAISRMIKSIRGSDPDAALYWLAQDAGRGRGT